MSKFVWNPLVSLSRSFLRSPDWMISAVAGEPVEIDGRILNRALQLMLAMPGVGLGRPGSGVERRRLLTNLSAQLGTPKLKNVDVVSQRIPGPESDIPIRTYRSFEADPTPATIVYYHGGGWVVGDLESHDGVCRAFAAASKCLVVSVDYRLAPEHSFPAAVDDALAAYSWTADNPGELDARPGAVAVMGDSAGGNLAAVVAQQARDLRIQRPLLQGLVYPSVDLNIDTQSSDPLGTDFFLTLEEIDWFRGHYLDPDSGEQRNDPRASPLFGELTNLPPALIWTAGFDPLRSEGARYAKALSVAGNQVRYRCYNEQTHGFLNMGILPGGMLRLAEIGRQLGSTLRALAG
jgi:acetyl esterase